MEAVCRGTRRVNVLETGGVIKESHGEVERLIVRRVGMVGMVRKMGIIGDDGDVGVVRTRTMTLLVPQA